jgi:hypothetical protein
MKGKDGDVNEEKACVLLMEMVDVDRKGRSWYGVKIHN